MDSTYEGLKRWTSRRQCTIELGLDSTYEGLKPGLLRVEHLPDQRLDSTYEGLKLRTISYIAPSFPVFGQYL